MTLAPTSPTPVEAPGAGHRLTPDAVRRRAAERCCALTRMFWERPQLAGVHDRADLAAELALWSV